MTPLQENQLRVLNETIAAYTSDTRSVIGYKCKYYKDDHQGCAVGRLIPDIELRKYLDSQPNTGIGGVFGLLPKDVQDLGEDFLVELQDLHDDGNCWSENGLSFKGKQIVNHIKNKFDLD